MLACLLVFLVGLLVGWLTCEARAVEHQKPNQTTPYGVVWLSFWCSTSLSCLVFCLICSAGLFACSLYLAFLIYLVCLICLVCSICLVCLLRFVSFASLLTTSLACFGVQFLAFKSLTLACLELAMLVLFLGLLHCYTLIWFGWFGCFCCFFVHFAVLACLL